MSFTVIAAMFLLTNCGNNKSASSQETTANKSAADNKKESPSSSATGDGIVGEWEQEFTCFDKNGNYTLEPEEKTPSNNTVGFNWFKFNADGTCFRDKEVKFESTYEIKNKGDDKELVIQNVHGYTIVELTEKELILGAEGAFMIFKRV